MRQLSLSELAAILSIFDALELTIWIAAAILVLGASIKHYFYRRYRL